MAEDPDKAAACSPHPAPTDAEVDAVIEEFGGDSREAIRALLHDVAVLAADLAGTVSRGYVRGRGPRPDRRAAGIGGPAGG